MKVLSDKELSALTSNADWSIANMDFILYGHTESLAKLLESNRPVPPETRYLIASYLRGSVQLPDMRGKKNSTLTPSDKRWIEEAITSLWHRTETVLMHLPAIADDQRKEPIEIKRYIESVRKEAVEKIAKKFGIKVNTVRQLHKPKELSEWGQVFAGERNLQTPDGIEIDFSKFFGKSTESLRASALREARDYMKDPEVFFDPLRYEAT